MNWLTTRLENSLTNPWHIFTNLRIYEFKKFRHFPKFPNLEKIIFFPDFSLTRMNLEIGTVVSDKKIFKIIYIDI